MPEIELTGKIREVREDGEHYKLLLEGGGLFFVWDKKLWGLLDAFGEAGTEITFVHDGAQYPKVLRIRTIKGVAVKEKTRKVWDAIHASCPWCNKPLKLVPDEDEEIDDGI